MQTLEVGVRPICGFPVHVLEAGVWAPCGIATYPHRLFTSTVAGGWCGEGGMTIEGPERASYSLLGCKGSIDSRCREYMKKRTKISAFVLCTLSGGRQTINKYRAKK